MYHVEQLFKNMSTKDLQTTLYSFLNDDYTKKDFTKNKFSRDFLYMLEFYNLVYVSNNNRVLLTSVGEKILQQLNTSLI